MAKRKTSKKVTPTSSPRTHAAHYALWLIIIGILIILNDWRSWVNWPQFVGILFIIWGLSKFAHK